jgi:hypothetical protein
MKAMICLAERLLNNEEIRIGKARIRMVHSRGLLFAAILLVATLSGCSGITNPQSQLNPGALSVDFPDGTELLVQGGTVFSTAADGSTFNVFATSNVSGSNVGDEMTLVIPVQATLPYTVTSQTDGLVDVGYWDSEGSGTQYDGNFAQGNCTVTITQISPTLVGTFRARVVCPSIPDSIELSNGEFNASPQ